jgi:hypothetical protein
MRWTGKLAVIGIVAITALPTAWSVQQQPIVAGHTTYAAMDGLDPCIAGIVGIVRLRVMWFNDQVLFERPATDGGSHVYAVQSGAPDPRDALLTPTGTEYPFTDPNGMDWTVREYAYHAGPAGGVDAGNYSVNPTSGQPVKVEEEPSYQANTDTASYHAWVVETGPSIQDFAATGRSYNFVNLVDTCKFTVPKDGSAHHQNNGGGNWSSDWGNDTTEAQHLASDPSHSHDRFRVDLYVGKVPKVEAVRQGDGFLGEVS